MLTKNNGESITQFWMSIYKIIPFSEEELRKTIQLAIKNKLHPENATGIFAFINFILRDEKLDWALQIKNILETYQYGDKTTTKN